MFPKMFLAFRFYLLTICVLICPIANISCQNSHKENNSNHSQNTSERSLQTKKLIIVDDIQVLRVTEEHVLDSSEMFNSPYRVFSYVNVSCATCLDEIKQWNSLAKSLTLYNVPVILYLQSKDRYELLKYLIEKQRLASYSYPFVLDINNNYFKQNSMLNEEKRLYTVLVNIDNEILWIGDPLHSKNDRQKLLQIIENQSK